MRNHQPGETIRESATAEEGTGMKQHYGSTTHEDARCIRNAAILGAVLGTLGWALAYTDAIATVESWLRSF